MSVRADSDHTPAAAETPARPEPSRRAASIAARLFGSAALWATAVLVLAGVTLSNYYMRSVERGFDQRLHVYLKTLVAGVADGTFARENPGSFGEPRFELPLSGWYWQITRLDRNPPEATTSKSLFEEQLPRLEDAGVSEALMGTREGYAAGPENKRLRLVERTVDLGQDGRYMISIGAASGEIDKDVADFNFALLICFSLLGLGLVVTTGFQVGFGLRPLARIRAQLVEIRTGDRSRLDGAFPREIAPLAAELNALIESNRQIVKRARTHVGNLAHGLKTPLSVIANEANVQTGDPFAEKVREQAVLMRRQIDHHLERARLSAGIAFVGESSELKPVVEGLARTMEKIYRDRAIGVSIEVPGEIRARCERQDIEEMLGNLVDNACKWAKSEVAITAEAPDRRAMKLVIRLLVDDDGPGLTPEQSEMVLARGRRLDETKPGSGLGLAIVSELVSMYGGRLALCRSPQGGLRCELLLPAV